MWEARKYGETMISVPLGRWEIRDKDSKKLVAFVSGRFHGDDLESDANARLIATAPMLLEACRDALYTLYPEFNEHSAQETITKLKKALTKATYKEY